jgi:hypothetical protein
LACLLNNHAAALKVQQVRINRSAGRRREARVQSGIGMGDDVGNLARTFTDEPQDLPLALHPMTDEVADILLRIGDGRPMGREIDPVPTLPQFFQALHVSPHIAVRRDDNGRRPAHHVITGEQGIAPGETQVIGGVARRRDRGQLAPVNFQAFAISKHPVG